MLDSANPLARCCLAPTIEAANRSCDLHGATNTACGAGMALLGIRRRGLAVGGLSPPSRATLSPSLVKAFSTTVTSVLAHSTTVSLSMAPKVLPVAAELADNDTDADS